MAFFLSVSASFSTTFWVWAVISRRVFSASLRAHTQINYCKYFPFCVVSDDLSGWVKGKRNLKRAPRLCLWAQDLQTHMSSKFLRIDSGIFGLVTRTAFVAMSKQCRGTERKTQDGPFLTIYLPNIFSQSRWLVIRLEKKLEHCIFVTGMYPGIFGKVQLFSTAFANTPKCILYPLYCSHEQYIFF